MNKNIILITGGQRSGKSKYAEKLALSMSEKPVYIATSRIWDDEHRERIGVHKARRQKQWINIEEEKTISEHRFEKETILIDCITLWATNFFYDNKCDINLSFKQMKDEINIFTQGNNNYIFVTNEIGLGGVANDKIQRKFTDLLGMINQYIAEKSNKVCMIVSGISFTIKDNYENI